MKNILEPILRIVKSNPSALGTEDYYITLYDKSDFNDTNAESWFKENESEIAEELYETAEYKSIYVIHSSTTRGEDIRVLNEGNNISIYNRINCDSILSYHCLALKIDETKLKLRTGFHETHPEVGHSELPFSWNMMNKISNNYQEIEVDKDAFFKQYNEITEKWKKQITRRIKHS